LRRRRLASKNAYRPLEHPRKISIARIRERAKSLFSLGSRFRARIFFYIAIQAARRGEPRLDRQPSSNPSAELLKRGRA